MPVTTSRKDLRNQIAQTLNTTFIALRDEIGPKKFKRNIKNASKMLLKGVKPSIKKKTAKKVKSVAKTDGVAE